MNQASSTPCVVATDKRLSASLVAARSATPAPSVVEVNRTVVPSAPSVVQPEIVPEVVKLVDEFALAPTAKLAKLAATSEAVTAAEADTVMPAKVKLWPAVMSEKVTRAFSVTAALLLINVAETPMFAVFIASTTPLGVGLVTLTDELTPGVGPWFTTISKPVPPFKDSDSALKTLEMTRVGAAICDTSTT